MTSHAWGDTHAGLGVVIAGSAAGITATLSADAWQRVHAARAIVDRYTLGDERIYGLNTGLGGNVGFDLSRAEMQAFQAQMIRGRCIGIGEAFPEPVARTMLLCRLIGMAQGGSGISPAVLELMLAMFNAGLTPVVPGRGSIGGGDLGLCAHLGAAVIGEGEIFVAGRRLPAAAALAAAGLQPAALGPKDGLAILNSSAVSCGHAAHVLQDLAALLSLSVVTASLADEGYAANPQIFDPRLPAPARPAARRAPRRCSARCWTAAICTMSAPPARSRTRCPFACWRRSTGRRSPASIPPSKRWRPRSTRPPTIRWCWVEDDLILSTANFHTPAIALAFDMLAIAMVHLATASAYRTIKMMNPNLSGLAKYLSPVGGASTGFNSLQKTVAYLHAELRLKAAPASLDALPVSDGVEDHAPQTPLAIRKLEEQLVPLRYLFAIEAMVAAQAVELRGRPRLAPATQVLFDAIRAEIPMLTDDRAPGPDADRINALFLSARLGQDIEQALGQGEKLFALAMAGAVGNSA